MPQPQVSVVMPAHNEEQFLEAAVREVVDGLTARGMAFELLVVENGSADATRAVADGLAAELEQVRSLSFAAPDYGRSLRHGFLEATGAIVVNFDVDYFDLDFLDQALAAMADDDVAIVIGTKRSPDSVDTRPVPRRIVTAGFTTILRLGFGLRASDTHGMKALRRAPLLPLVEAARFGTDLFDTELVLQAERAGVTIVEIPVRVEERRPSRTPIARRALRTVVGLGRLRIAIGGARAARR
jgi:glycosyltransferase involved in cell wall biosynthesis